MDTVARYIHMYIEDVLDVLRITSKSAIGARLELHDWYLFARRMMFRGVSFNHQTDQHTLDAGPETRFFASRYVREFDISLDEYHRHARVMAATKNIETLRIDASSDLKYECQYCGDNSPSWTCFIGESGIKHLHIKLGKKFAPETSQELLWIPGITRRMSELQTLEIYGKTDRTREWISQTIIDVQNIQSHVNKPPIQIDCSKLQVPKVVEVQYVSFGTSSSV